ncbi:class I SAM-dependent methyltransferase [Kitasatospora sp. YST-16]|uniref:O-methyltransferase n=1 Tax=unclassified Kitasatospora TaxID=2633591 RepID=UPI0004C3EEB7|nr:MULTISPECIES: class I SAM-dependent methyltransferase [unclassified Kitasatospora]WAL70728.1 class I SAM-dependent methyltransferase [Kitasatospora sp. YST-16]WNW36767.1 class I SAM-dependent methyltransferase [Streptomyces sp. Li-HN-5-13]
MSVLGTAAYTDTAALPEPVARAVELAARLGFTQSCRPEQGRLLQALAAGATGRIGETGTGCGVGLAWLLAGRRPGVRVVSVEREPERVAAVRELFADVPDLEVLHGDWTLIDRHGPFDLLVLDGGGNGKQSAAADPEQLLTPGGTLVVDDLTPLTAWPPTYRGAPDTGRTTWYDHPALLTTEIRLAPDFATLLATRRP